MCSRGFNVAVSSFIGCKTPEALRTMAMPLHGKNGAQEKRLAHPIKTGWFSP
jgi:hypothetical protein